MPARLSPRDSLPEADHLLRYVRRKFVDGDDNQIDGNAFLSRPSEEGGPSFNWMEFFERDAPTRIEEIRRLRRLKYEKRGRVGRLNVGQTRAYVRERMQRAIDFIYDPLPDDAARNWPADPSHAYLSNIPVIDSPEGEAVGDLIAHCILESWPVAHD
jgi:hypothetical protein